MYIVTDMCGNINGWTRYVHEVLELNDLRHMKLAKLNLLMLCPHLIDFIFPKVGSCRIGAGESHSFDQPLLFFSPQEKEKGFTLYEAEAEKLKKLQLDHKDEKRLVKCRKIMVELFNDVQFKCGNLYKLTMSVTRYCHRFGVDFLTFKIEFY